MSINFDTSNIVLISAERADLSTSENALRTTELARHLDENGFYFESVLGRYEGSDEHSYAVRITGPSVTALESFRKVQLAVLDVLAIRFNQDSILVIEGGVATLRYFDVPQHNEHIGRWTRVDRETAEAAQGHTIVDRGNGLKHYYITK
jgi:hypothetical protein